MVKKHSKRTTLNVFERYITMKVKSTLSPMGWNSFDCYGCTVFEEDVRGTIDYMSAHLLQYGYQYVVVDNGWFAYHNIEEGEKYPVITVAEKETHEINIDANGRVESSDQFFPSGIQAVADYAHQKGLLFGVHLMRGVPRKAVEQKCLIQGTNITADQIADKNSVCPWCNYNYGVDMRKEGAQAYYDSVIRKMADMGIDFIKYDDITAHKDEIEGVVKALEKVDRKIVLSLSPGDDTIEENMETYQKATMLRVTGDIWDSDESIDNAFKGLNKYYTYQKDDFFIDLDMLCVGHLRLNMPKSIVDKLKARNENYFAQGQERVTRMSKAQQRSFMTVRAICASPLMIGADVMTLDDFTFDLITNKEMIACNQHTKKCQPLTMEKFVAWQSDAGYIALFNRQETTEVDLSILPCGQKYLDVWGQKELLKSDTVTVLKSDVLFLKILQ